MGKKDTETSCHSVYFSLKMFFHVFFNQNIFCMFLVIHETLDHTLICAEKFLETAIQFASYAVKCTTALYRSLYRFAAHLEIKGFSPSLFNRFLEHYFGTRKHEQYIAS